VLKKKYFAKNFVNFGASELRKEILKSTVRDSFDLSFKNSALLILDMQNYFLDPKSHAFVPVGLEIIENIQKLAELYYSNDRPIIFTRHINSEENAGSMKSWWKEIITEENPLSEIHPDIANPYIPAMIKSQYDAFYNTDLDEQLKSKDVKEVVIAGVMTHLCCESTARSAFIQGYKVHFPIDATGTYNKQYHKSTLLNLSHGFASIPTVEMVIKSIKEQI
jgi:nicotinamidase-related amidase